MRDIIIKHIEAIEPYTGPHAIPGVRFRPAREALGVDAWGMNVLELDPNVEGYPEHDHATDRQQEVYVVLRGSAILQAQGEAHTVVVGDLVHVGPSVRRKFVTRDEGVTLLALGGTPGEVYKPGMGGS